jgi:NTE family protein
MSEVSRPAADPSTPVSVLGPQEEGELRPEIALCLSGGGYRAMLFHVGALWRLTETGLLAKLDRVSSVSGGSITAGCLALAWDRIAPGTAGAGDRFRALVVAPVRKLAGKTVDEWSVFGGILTPGVAVSDLVARSYRDVLFGDKTLQDLPDAPRFVINATNVQSGALWRFMKPYMRDYLVGEVKDPDVPLATAVAASSAFPPVLSPVRLSLDPASFTPGSGRPDPEGGPGLQREPFTSEIVLSDGGVYDNLGLETAWKRCRTILVSDAGAKIAPDPEPAFDWARHSMRVLDLIDNQVRSLRKRQLIDSYREAPGTPNHREGAYWGIRTDIADYGLADPLPCPPDRTRALAEVPTRLKRMEPVLQERLINWGYAVCDAAVRAHVAPETPPPEGFPYPSSGV